MPAFCSIVSGVRNYHISGDKQVTQPSHVHSLTLKFQNDYSPLAFAAGVTHYSVRETSLCGILDCPPRGCNDTDGHGPNRDDITVEPKVITAKIREMVAKYHSDRKGEEEDAEVA